MTNQTHPQKQLHFHTTNRARQALRGALFFLVGLQVIATVILTGMLVATSCS